MSKRVRLLLGVLCLGLLLVGGLVASLIGPRLGAVRCLLAFQWPVPEDLKSLSDAPNGFTLLADAGRYGVEQALVRSTGEERRPTLLFVHGVAQEGLRDGRILRAIEGFHRGGFTVVAPEIRTLMDATAPAGEVQRLVTLLQAIHRGDVAGADGRQMGIVGISVGGAVALRMAAAYQAAGGEGLRAVLSIGAADDIRTVAKTWFALPDPAKKGDGTLQWKRRDAGAFARSFIARAAVPTLLGQGPEAEALLKWLREKPLPVRPPPALSTPEAQGLRDFIGAAPEKRAAQRERLLEAAWSRLGLLSPADWDQELHHLTGLAIFLLHGHGDPLVSIDQVEPLQARLARHTLVSVLRSHMVGHADVAQAALGEHFDHVLFMDDFLDMVAR